MREHTDQIFGYGTLRSLHLWIRVSRRKRFRTRDLYSQQRSLETDFQKKWGNIPTKSLVTGPCVHSIYEYESQDKSVLEQETCIHNKVVSRQIFIRNEGIYRPNLWLRDLAFTPFMNTSLKTKAGTSRPNLWLQDLAFTPFMRFRARDLYSQQRSLEQIFRRNEGTSRPNLWLRDLAFTPFMNTSLKTKAF